MHNAAPISPRPAESFWKSLRSMLMHSKPRSEHPNRPFSGQTRISDRLLQLRQTQAAVQGNRNSRPVQSSFSRYPASSQSITTWTMRTKVREWEKIRIEPRAPVGVWSCFPPTTYLHLTSVVWHGHTTQSCRSQYQPLLSEHTTKPKFHIQPTPIPKD